MSFENWHTLTWSDIPYSAGLIDRSSTTHVSSELKLSTGYLTGMSLQYMDRLTCFRIPNLYKMSLTIAVPSNDPVRILSPSALKFKETIYPSWPLRVECYFPVYKSHNLAVWSIDPVAHRLLWGSKATATTSFWCPAYVDKHLPVSVSHSLAVQSKLPVTILSLNHAYYTQMAHWRPKHRQHFYALLTYVVNCQFMFTRSGMFYRSFQLWIYLNL